MSDVATAQDLARAWAAGIKWYRECDELARMQFACAVVESDGPEFVRHVLKMGGPFPEIVRKLAEMALYELAYRVESRQPKEPRR